MPPPHAFDDAAWVGYRLSEAVPVQALAKQKLLELEILYRDWEILTPILRNAICLHRGRTGSEGIPREFEYKRTDDRQKYQPDAIRFRAEGQAASRSLNRVR